MKIYQINFFKNEPQWAFDYRLEAVFGKMTEPNWAQVKYEKPDFQNISYYAAPKKKKELQSLDEVDPELLRTMEKLEYLLQTKIMELL